MGLDFASAAAQFTPAGAASELISGLGGQSAATSGDISSGGKTFDVGGVGGIVRGSMLDIPPWVWYAAAGFALLYVAPKYLKRK